MRFPALGTRVMIRYRLPAGSTPPLTDVIGHLVEAGTTLQVRTKRGEVVRIATDDVVVIKALTAAPVRTADIRNLEHAAALAWPGVEQQWIDGWLLRFGRGSTRRANSAVPLDGSASTDLAPIIDWYAARGVPPLVAAPDRLFRVPQGASVDAENLVMVRDLATEAADSALTVTLSARPDDEWLRLYRRPVPVEVLTAVVDGDVAFGTIAGSAVGRAAVTDAPDGTRWLGLSAVHVDENVRARGFGRALCRGLLAWGAAHGARRAYVQVLVDNDAAIRLFESMGFTIHHHSRYVRADTF